MKKTVSTTVYLVTLISILSWAKSVLIEECPEPADVYPCYCDEDEEFTTMHCNYLNESNQLSQALSKQTDYKIFEVSIYKNEIKSIKSDAFKGPAITQIIFTNSTIYMESPQFVGLENSLTRLTFMACFDVGNAMSSWNFKHLNKLKEVSFEKNTIKTLKNNWLSSTGPRLRSLTFFECGIQELEDKIFQKVEDLATLFLNNNEITSITRSMFPSVAESLRIINLNNNKLQDLPDDIFENMPSLNSLELQRNFLKTLSESGWSSVIESLFLLDLDENPIRCYGDLKWITERRLPKLFTGTCSYPAKLKNRNLRTLIPADFN